MKNFVTLALVLSLLTASVAAPKRAEAALGIGSLALGGVPLLVVGGVLAGGGVALSGWGIWAVGYAAGDNSFTGTMEHLVGLLAVVGGLVLLDGSGGRDIAFSPVSPQDADKLGLTPEEMRSYNAELPEINAVRESVQGEVVSEVNDGKSAAEIDVHARWQSYRDLLAPESFSALEKVSAHMIESLKLRAPRAN